MNILFLIQFTWCVVTVMLAMMLVASRFQMRWPNHRYEVSRRLLVGAMLLLTVHFILQMSQGYRAKSDELGTVVNLLFFTPVVFLVSYATYHVVCYREGRRQYITVGAISYAALLAAFFVGILQSGSLHPGPMLYAMFFCFVICMLYCIIANIREIRHHRKIMEEETAEDMLPYDRYTWASYVLVCASIIMIAASIFFRLLLLVIAPVMLVSLIIFTMNFIGYGYNIMPSELVEEEEEAEDTASSQPLENPSDKITKALDDWVANGGFRDSAVTLPMLSKKLKISRSQLTAYFEQQLNSSFRTWLSGIRYKEAQRMLLENSDYSNDTISAECGFSSRTHLYRVFKLNTGLTPLQWREKVSHS